MIQETLQISEKPSFLILECKNVKANIESLRKFLPQNGRLMAVIKAFGYGQDDVRFAGLLTDFGIDIFGVSQVEEGVNLRRFGIKGDIFVVHALPNEAKVLLEWDLQVGVSSLAFIEALAKEAEAKGKITKVHLHLNTGMTRFGIHPGEALMYGKKIAASPFLKLEGLMTHFPSAEDAEQDPFTHAEIKTIESAFDALTAAGISIPWVHVANSAGLLRHAPKRCNMARVGLALFGVPNEMKFKIPVPLKPAISLVSKIVHIHDCTKGDTVSYNRDYRIAFDGERIGVISCGYHDGIPRSVSGKGYVFVRGKKAFYTGRVCMDNMMVNLTDIPEAEVGDEALIFGAREGSNIPIELFASWAGTITHEVLCRISGRVSRIYE